MISLVDCVNDAASLFRLPLDNLAYQGDDMRDFLTGLAHDRNSSLQHLDYQLHPNTSSTLSKKFTVVDWCYRKINPTYIYTECWPGAASGPWRPPYREAPQ